MIDWIPLFVMVVLVGLSMDYHVFVISRIREHVQNGLPTRLAVEQGIRDTAGVVTSAAAVMVSVFAIFATLSMMEMKMMGVGLSAAILIDATVIRLVMLPAILVLLGDRAWWPHEAAGAGGHEVVEEPEPAYALSAADRIAAGRRTRLWRRPAGLSVPPGYFRPMQSRRCRGGSRGRGRRSRRRKRTVSAYRRDGKVIVMIPDRFTRAEEAEWVTTMLAAARQVRAAAAAHRRPADAAGARAVPRLPPRQGGADLGALGGQHDHPLGLLHHLDR